MQRRSFKIGNRTYVAEAMWYGILLNPELPWNFDATPNGDRSAVEISRWEMRPYIMSSGILFTDVSEELRRQWEAEYPSGIRYEVRCLDFAAWDCSSSWGMFSTLEAAVQCARDRRRLDHRVLANSS